MKLESPDLVSSPPPGFPSLDFAEEFRRAVRAGQNGASIADALTTIGRCLQSSLMDHHLRSRPTAIPDAFQRTYTMMEVLDGLRFVARDALTLDTVKAGHLPFIVKSQTTERPIQDVESPTKKNPGRSRKTRSMSELIAELDLAKPSASASKQNICDKLLQSAIASVPTTKILSEFLSTAVDSSRLKSNQLAETIEGFFCFYRNSIYLKGSEYQAYKKHFVDCGDADGISVGRLKVCKTDGRKRWNVGADKENQLNMHSEQKRKEGVGKVTDAFNDSESEKRLRGKIPNVTIKAEDQLDLVLCSTEATKKRKKMDDMKELHDSISPIDHRTLLQGCHEDGVNGLKRPSLLRIKHDLETMISILIGSLSAEKVASSSDESKPGAKEKLAADMRSLLAKVKNKLNERSHINF